MRVRVPPGVLFVLRKFDIAVDGREIVQKRTGLSRYLISFLETIGEKGKFALIISNKETDTDFISLLLKGRCDFVYLPFDSPYTDQFLIPYYIIGRTNLYFSIYPKFPVILPFLGIDVFITVADMINFSFAQKLFLKFFGKLPKGVITISDTWKKKVESFIGREAIRVYSDIHYVKERFERNENGDTEVRKLGITPGKYLLYVGNFNPHKNVRNLVEAFKLVSVHLPDLELVLAGGGGRNEQYFDVPPRCKIIRSPDDKLLRKLYRHAFAYISASLMEGLGNTPLEACYFGKALLLSDIEVFRETVGGCALFFDPLSPKDIAQKIIMLYRNPKLKQKLEERSKENAKRFLSFKMGELIYDFVFSSQKK